MDYSAGSPTARHLSADWGCPDSTVSEIDRLSAVINDRKWTPGIGERLHSEGVFGEAPVVPVDVISQL